MKSAVIDDAPNVVESVRRFGNVGEAAARLMHERGARLIAVTDVRGGAFSAEGLDPARLKAYLDETGSVAGTPGSEPIDNASLLALDCDVLVLAALEGQVTGGNAGEIRATVIAEGANGPVTPDADPVLAERGVVTVPDILCNAGGVVVSYFEWVQNLQSHAWNAQQVVSRLREVMAAAFDSVWQMSQRERIDPRLAAHAIAVARVAEAHRLRGLYP